MQVSIETTSGLERKLTVGVPAEVVDKEVQKRLQDAAKSVRINGFRKGKVPFKVVKQQYGKGVRQEVVGDTINRTFYEAVQKEDIKPAGQPAIEPTKMEEGQDLEYVATFEVYPEVESINYEGIEVVRHDADIADKDIDKMIENLRKGQAEWVDTKAMAKEGFKVNINFEGKKDGETFDGGTADNHELELGSNTMIPGFEDGIVGMKPGETKDVDVTFPEEYQVDDLKGAAVTFSVTVNSAQKQKLPDLDDAFFEKFGVSEGGEEKFREDVKGNMDRELQKAVKTKVKQQVLDALIEKNSLEVPSALVANEIQALREQTMQQYGGAVKGLDMTTLLPDDMFREQAKKRSALGLLVSEVVIKEELSADKDTVRKLIEETAATYADPEEVINYYYNNEQLLKNVEAAALEEQVVELVLGKASVKDEKVAYDEAIAPLPQKEAAPEEA
ncbi:MAG: trigger factor [Agarilytica sp.]